MWWFAINLAYFIFPILGYLQYRYELMLYPDRQPEPFRARMLFQRKPVSQAIQLMRWGFWACMISFFSIMPLMGLPGALLIGVYELTGLLPELKRSGDILWPSALLVSILAPLAWPLALLIRNALFLYWKIQIAWLVKAVIIIYLIGLMIGLKWMI